MSAEAAAGAELVTGLKESFSSLLQAWLVRRAEERLGEGLILHLQRWQHFIRHLEGRVEGGAEGSVERGAEGSTRDGWLDELASQAAHLYEQGTGLDQVLATLDEEFLLLQEALYERGISRAHLRLRPLRAEAGQALVRGYVRAIREKAEDRALAETRQEHQARIERLERRVSELLTLSELTGLISTNLSLKETLDTVAALACRLVGTERASIALRAPGEDHMIMDPTMGHMGTPEEFLEAWRLKLDEGVGGWAFQHQEPVVVENADQDARFTHQLAKEEGVQSWIVAPLVARGESIGLLYALNTRPTRFTPDQVHTITTLAHQSAIAIQNARLFEATIQREKEARTLYDVATLLASLDYSQLVERILAKLSEAVHFHVAALTIEGSGGAHTVIQIQEAVSPRLVERVHGRLAEAHGLITGRSLESVDGRVRRLGEERLTEDGPSQAPSFMTVPLIASKRVMGVFGVASARPGVYTSGDLKMLSTIANHLAVALDNAQLLEDLRRANQELERWAQELEERVEERTRELRQAQSQLLRAERLAAIGQVGAGVAHELRNPLGIIKNSAFFVRHKVPQEDARVARHLAIMDREIDRSNRIITALMEFSRSPQPQIRPDDLHQAIEEAVRRVQIHAGIEVVRRFAELPPAPVDREQLSQALANVLLNAVQAMAEGGVITLRTAARDGRAVIEIEDTGHGIATENVGRVFEPLWTTKTQGIGLGLPIARAWIESQRGRMELESQEGRGTRVRISLPLEAAESEPARQAAREGE